MFDVNLNKICCNNRYRLILMDLNMPIMDGYEATMHILEKCEEHNERVGVDELKVNCQIMAVTSFLNEENKKKCYRVGMVDVIHKPVDFQILKKAIDKYYFDY